MRKRRQMRKGRDLHEKVENGKVKEGKEGKLEYNAGRKGRKMENII